jgi:predicted HD superfamily hydrolase involved in NAD metabolism
MIDDIRIKLRNMLDEKRYKHSLGVQETAVKLAEKYIVDVNKASLAGLVHDCAKGFTNDKLLILAEEYSINVKDIYRIQPELLHGAVGAFYAKGEFLIYDEEVLHSIRYHTTGCENMSMLDKIIYIADYIEPGRRFPGVEDLRKETYNDIDKGVLIALDLTIKYVLEKKQLLDVLTIDARNYMLKTINYI